MNSIKKLAAGMGAVGLLVAAAPALATPSLTFTTDNYGTQSVDPFGGIEWDSAGTAVAVGFNPVLPFNPMVTTTYWASANALKNPGGVTFNTPGITPPVGAGDGWEFTVKATIFESSTCVAFAGPVCAISAFTTVGGTWDVYFDSLANANQVTGAGITDGDLVFSGTILPGLPAGTFLVTDFATGSGSGVFSFRGDVGYANPAFIDDPDLVPFSKATATLQLGANTTGWTAPTSLPGASGGTTALPSACIDPTTGLPGPGLICFQADGNQSFIPEPGTLALLGLGMLGMFGTARRRKA